MQEAKRRRVVFATDAEMPSADTAPYLQWKTWRDGPSSSAVAFLSPEDCGAMAAALHARLLLDGLDLQGVDLLTRWAGPDMEMHEVLLLLAMFECVSGLVLDVTSGEWVRQGTDASSSASSDDPQFVGEADLQHQINECECRMQGLRGPRVPAFSHEAMTRLAGGPLPWVWQRDAVHALRRFVKTDTSKAARARWTLAEDVWRLLYRSADSPGPASSGRQQMPGPTKVPLRPGGGPPGACFRCGLYGHWARDCDRGVPAFGPQLPQAPPHLAAESSQPTQGPTQLSQQVPVNIPAPGWKGGFTQVGAQTLFTVYSTGRTYDASGPPPYPCSKCGLMHWSWQGCPAPSASSSVPLAPQTPSIIAHSGWTGTSPASA